MQGKRGKLERLLCIKNGGKEGKELLSQDCIREWRPQPAQLQVQVFHAVTPCLLALKTHVVTDILKNCGALIFTVKQPFEMLATIYRSTQ